MKEGKTVGIWIRVSTDDQAEGDSPQHHEARARWYCTSKGWEVVTIYHLEAISGKSVLGHTEAKRMLNDIKEGHITGMVFSKLARVARNTRELLLIAEHFQENNADLISLEENIDTSTPSGRFFYTMFAAMAQWEREEIASRVAASVPVRAKLGKPLGGAAPFGFCWAGEKNKQIVVDEKEAPIRKLLYEIFARTRRKKTTAAELNNLGYRTRTGGLFTGTTVDRLLRDPSAKGIRRANYTKSRGNKKHWDLKPSSEWIMTECPPIVSETLWDECNQYLMGQYTQRRKPGRQSEYLLSGFVECHCGAKMYVYHSDQKYKCKKCKNKISVNDIDEIFRGQLKHFLFTEAEAKEYQEQVGNILTDKLNLFESSKRDAHDLEQKLGSLVEMRIRQEISADTFTLHYQPLKDRLADLKKTLSQLQGQMDLLENQMASSETILADARDLYTRWPELSEQDRRIIVENITEQIVVDNQCITVRLAYLPNHTSLEKSGKRQRNFKDSSMPAA